MDPLELLDLCCRCAREGAPRTISIPRMFTAGDFEATWRLDPKAVRARLDAILCAEHPGDGLEMLLKTRALGALLPELEAIKNLGDDPVAALHKDVWEHTKYVVAGVPNQLELRWGALMHDIGKARTRRVGNGGTVSFHNHDIVGAKMVDGIQRRLGLFNDDEVLLGTVRALVLNHLRPASYRASWSDSGVRRLMADMGGPTGFEKLMALSRADLTTKNPAKRAKAMVRATMLEQRVCAVYAADNAPKLPKGTMGTILEKVAARPGPWVNDLRQKLEDMMAIGLLNVGEPADYYVKAGLAIVEQAADSDK